MTVHTRHHSDHSKQHHSDGPAEFTCSTILSLATAGWSTNELSINPGGCGQTARRVLKCCFRQWASPMWVPTVIARIAYHWQDRRYCGLPVTCASQEGRPNSRAGLCSTPISTSAGLALGRAGDLLLGPWLSCFKFHQARRVPAGVVPHSNINIHTGRDEFLPGCWCRVPCCRVIPVGIMGIRCLQPCLPGQATCFRHEEHHGTGASFSPDSTGI